MTFQLVQNYICPKGEENLITYWDSEAWDFLEKNELRWNNHKLLTLGYQWFDLIYQPNDEFSCWALACELNHVP